MKIKIYVCDDILQDFAVTQSSGPLSCVEHVNILIWRKTVICSWWTTIKSYQMFCFKCQTLIEFHLYIKVYFLKFGGTLWGSTLTVISQTFVVSQSSKNWIKERAQEFPGSTFFKWKYKTSHILDIAQREIGLKILWNLVQN